MFTLKNIFRAELKNNSRGLSWLSSKYKQQCDPASKEEDDCTEKGKCRKNYPILRCFKELDSCLNAKDPLSVEGCDCPRVIIVGAGIAGLSAAEYLYKNGCENIVLLEASDRIGGRVHTSWMGDTVIEMGPNTIHGASLVNPLYPLANMEGAVNPKLSRVESDKVNYLTSDCRIIEQYIIADILFKKFLEQAKVAHKINKSDISLLDFLCIRIQQELLNVPSHMRFDTERLLFGMVNNLTSTIGKDLAQVSTQQLEVNQKLPGGDMRIPQGFCTLLAQMIRNIPPDIILLNKTVGLIEWCAGQYPKIVVRCCEGDCFTGDLVILALPLGVLKQNLYCMFRPVLPEPKLNAISKLGVGHLNRVYLEYVTPWWIPSELNMRIAWSPAELKEWSLWTKGIGTIEELPSSKRVIMFTVGGDDALAMEAISEVEIAIQFTNFIRNFLCDKSIPYPNNIAVSRWSCHPNYQGGSVYMPVGTSIGLIKDLFTPTIDYSGAIEIPPILIAGEAAHEKYYGTAHAARASGIREAERVLRSVREKYALELNDNNQVAFCN